MTPAARAGATRVGIAAIALMLMSMFFTASNDALGKYLTQSYSIWQVLWIRSWVWVAFALVWTAYRGGIGRAWRSQVPLLQVVRSLVLVAEVSVFIFALRHLPLANVTAIGSAAPLVVLVLAVVFLGERVGFHRWAAVGCGMVGMLVIAGPSINTFGAFSFVPVLGVLLWGIYQILLRTVSHVDSEETTLLWTGFAIFIVTGLIAPWSWQTPPGAADWGWFLLVGILNTAAHFTLILAMHRSEASALAPFSYTVIFWAILIGWLAFDESPSIWTFAGAALIATGGLYALHRERQRTLVIN